MSGMATYRDFDKGVLSGKQLTDQVMRKVIAIPAAPGFFAGAYIFIASFFGFTMEKLGAKPFLLHIGVFALAIPLAIVDRWSKGVNPISGKPRWVVRSMQILGLLCIALLFVFLALSHAASPEIINGEYVLNDGGKIASYISEREYFFLKGWELRLFASGWMLAYYALMMHWWFPRQEPWTVVMPGEGKF
jgi:hypothetical protein